jgi:hypothetical protein
MPSIKKLPWMSLGLLLVSYTSLGWTMSNPNFPRLPWIGTICEQISESLIATPKVGWESHICEIITQYNLTGALLSVAWVLLVAIAFMSPLTSFSRFITQSFKSDTAAFLSVFMLAGLATLILFWMHIFLQILTILAAESLARLYIQVWGGRGRQAFWILVLVSITGLSLGWIARLLI